MTAGIHECTMYGTATCSGVDRHAKVHNKRHTRCAQTASALSHSKQHEFIGVHLRTDVEGTFPQNIAGVFDASKLVAIWLPVVPINVLGALPLVDDLGVVHWNCSCAVQKGVAVSSVATKISTQLRCCIRLGAQAFLEATTASACKTSIDSKSCSKSAVLGSMWLLRYPAISAKAGSSRLKHLLPVSMTAAD